MIQEVRETAEQENVLSPEEEAIALAVATDTTEIVAQEAEEEETRVLEQPFKDELEAVEMAEVDNSENCSGLWGKWRSTATLVSFCSSRWSTNKIKRNG